MNRTLRLLLLIVVAVVQLAVAGDAIVRYELTLRYGESLRFRVQPIDPVDSFRGRYVALTFEANRAEIPEGLEIPNRGWIFVPVVVAQDGFARLGGVSLSRPSSGPYL
ncbi:MAG: GDYXXLXY domain-containing protein, partial [Acidobacteriota bacterium]